MQVNKLFIFKSGQKAYMRLTSKEKKLLVLGVIFTVILFGMKFAFPGLGGVTGYVVYEQTINGWDFETPDDYIYDSNLIEVAGGEAKLLLQTTTSTTINTLNLQLDSGSIDGISITNLNPSEYETAMLEEDDKYYIKGNKKIKEIPEALEGLLWIKTDDSDKKKEINVGFETDRTVTLFVGYDKRDEAPYWLSQWNYWGEGIETTAGAGTPFRIYYQNFEAGSVLLGSNNDSKAMYVILVNATVYESSKQTVSQPYGYEGNIRKIEWDAETPEGTSVKVRFKEAATEEELDGVSWSDYYTESGSAIDGQVSNGIMQYEALLETTDDSKTPVLRSVTLTFEEEAYPNSAKIETPDMAVDKVSNWGNLIAEEELNGQSISYEYSTDSGSTWDEAIEVDFSSASTAGGKIRIKAELTSDGVQTPLLDRITINYTYVSCEESWEAQYTACDATDTRIKYYADANSCGTGDGLPEDNGTAESCNYCTPQWQNVNGSCSATDTKKIAYYYTNSCCSETGLDSDCAIPGNTTSTCDYCAPSFTCAEYDECSSSGFKECFSVTDSEGCYEKTGLISDNYSDNISEFAVECSYDSEPPVISEITVSPTVVSPGESLTITARVTDESSSAASVTLRNEQKETVAGKAMSLANGSFRAVINTLSLIDGTYRIDVSANDTNGNTAAVRDAKLFAVTNKSAVVKQLELSSLAARINKTNPATNATDVFLEISGSGSGEISLITYETSQISATKPAKEAGKYVDIFADGALQQNITNTTLRIYYSDERISAANINENSIKINFYNETSGEWKELNTAVNIEENYAEATIYHYSTYALFGEENLQASPSTALSGGTGGYGGSGGGGTITTAKTEKTEEAAQTAEITPQKTEPIASSTPSKKETCSYDLAIELPEILNLATMTTVTGKATNTGTCDIDSLELKLTGKASELIGVKPSLLGYMKAGSTSTFNLTKSPQNIAPFQGLVVAEPQNGVTTYTGALHFEGISGKVVAVTDDIELTLELNGRKDKEGSAKWLGLTIASVLAAAVSGALIIRRKKKTEKTAKV